MGGAGAWPCETSSYPLGRRYSGPELRLAVCRDPVQTEAVLTAHLTGGAVGTAGWLTQMGSR